MKNILIGIMSCLAFTVSAQTYTFTTAGTSGTNGPDQTAVDAAYLATNLNGLVTINTQGIQEWTVPSSGTYQIQAIGASGGSHATLSGHGALISGDVYLTMGTTLYILAGQMGSQYAATNSDGGGGGSFITDGTDLLVAAGGGGGSAQNPNSNQDASLTAAVTNGAASQFGSAGAGYSTNGIHLTYGIYTTVAQSFTNGGNGQGGGQAGGWPGAGYGDGGFGGGGSACACSTGGGGGGGGFSGGGGGTDSPYISGFGGSSYTIGSATNVTSSIQPGLGDGSVTIISLCTPTILAADLASLVDITGQCSSTPMTPTATNNCGGIFDGVPDVAFPITTPGTTVVTWTYNDGQGNTTSQLQNVILADTIAPIADITSLPDLVDMCEVNSVTAPTATDNCMGTITGTTTTTFPISVPGASVITWTFDDGSGNISTQTQNVLNGAIDNVIQLVGSQLNATALVAGYQWLDCEANYAIIPGEVNQFYDATTTGTYAAEITQGGCVDTSECILVDFTAIDEMQIESMNIYPNPSTGAFTISSSDVIESIEVFDILGRTISLPINLNNGSVDGSELVNGNYMVTIKTNKGIFAKEIIILN